MQCNIPEGDLPARLENTICLYKDIPYIVHTTPHSTSLHLHDMVSGSLTHRIKSNDPDLDVATPPLGYCQYTPDRVVYITRRPHRRFQQGITYNGCYLEFMNKRDAQFHFCSEPTRRMMQKEYPILKELFESIRYRPSYMELAVSNDVALQSDGTRIVKVFFRNEEVGFIPMSDIKKDRATIVIPKSRKGWIVLRYLSEFNFDFK